MQRLSWQVSWWKGVLTTQTWCTASALQSQKGIAVSEGNCSQGLRLPWLSYSNVYLCPSSSASIPRSHFQTPSGEDFLRCVYWNALPPPGCHYGELDLKTFFLLHSDSVFSTFFHSKPPPCPSLPVPLAHKTTGDFFRCSIDIEAIPTCALIHLILN